MGSWTVTADRKPGVLWLKIEGVMSAEEMMSLVAQHNVAVDSFGASGYAVFCDIKEMKVLSPEAAEVFEQAKLYSGAKPNFRGSSVLVSSTVVAMQHRRTSVSGGVMATELIGSDEQELWEHIDALPAKGQ